MLLYGPLVWLFFSCLAFPPDGPVTAGSEGAVEAALEAKSARIRSGRIELEGTAYAVTLCDRNGNGRFDDAIRFTGPVRVRRADFLRRCDLLVLDPGEGPSGFRAPSPGILPSFYGSPGAETLAVGSRVRVKERFYALDVDPAGERITFRPWTGPMGAVAAAADRYEVCLLGEAGMVTLRGRCGEVLPLPAGRWWVASTYVEAAPRESPKGRDLLFHGRNSLFAVGTKESPLFTVRPGKTVLLPFGPPYRPVVHARVRSRGDTRRVYLSLTLVGAGGEEMESLRVNGRTPRQGPLLVILDRAGTVVHRGRFSYG